MKRFFYFAVICCMVMLTFSACEKDKEIGTTANLFGHWEAMVYSSEDMVFLSEVAEEGWYWGYEWNADDKPESDLLPGRYGLPRQRMVHVEKGQELHHHAQYDD